MSAAPRPRTLRDALDALGTADAEALVHLQGELIGASRSRLVRVGAEAGDPADALARRAAREGRLVLQRQDDAAEIAAPIDASHVAVHLMPRATPATLALAEERLELTAALFRARGNTATDWAGAQDLAQAFAGAARAGEAWTGAAVAVKRLVDARRVIVARVDDGRIGRVADSEGKLSSETLAGHRLAAGEALDAGGPLAPADPLPPALRGLAGEQRIDTRIGETGRRGVVLIAIGAAQAATLQAAADLLVALRPPAPQLLPAPAIDWLAGRLGERGTLVERRRRALLLLLLAPLLLLLVPVPLTVGAPVTVEALERRVVTAPFDGRIDSVLAEPGDRVRAGRTVLARLDARAAESERADVVAQLQGALSQAGVARTEGRGEDARLAQLQAQQLSARAEALALQVATAAIVAPIDGVLGGDDLRRRVGSPVTRGETLFVVAAPGRYRAEAKVSDRDIDRVAVGQRMALALRARVLSRPSATVTRIYPVAEVTPGDNIFRVVAAIDRDDATGMLPGMEGRASIRTGWAPLGWALLRGPVGWVRQTLWI